MPISQIVTNSIANTAVTSAKLASDAFSPQIIKPVLTSPANNATGILNNQLFTASPYLSLYGRSQANANWQISTSPTFAFINVNSTITGSNTEFQANASSGLVVNTIHYARVRYSDDANNSSEYSNTIQFTTASAFSMSNVAFLVIAGGGGGGGGSAGSGGGGGAGGYRESTLTNLSLSTNYTVTVGAAGTTGGISAVGTKGSNSVFASISSTGGGFGGYNTAGGTGGSAGGSGNDGSNQSTFPGAAGNQGGYSPSEGNNGGANYAAFLGWQGGGGGGAGGVGGAAPSGSGGVGGSGTTSSISGTSVARAGGGGGGSWAASGGTASAGGGAGSGGTGSGGTTNTGGGGGGGGQDAAGGNGGSGLVVLRYANNRTISNPGGGLTYTTSANGSNTIAIFTAGTGNVSWS
jgi:hypothetical protein